MPEHKSKISLSSSESAQDESNTAMISFAAAIFLLARSTPILSTVSSVSRRPAVSARRSVTLPIVTGSSTLSRVVPATDVTMDFSVSVSIFIRVDLPTFGLPTIAVSVPSVIA